jgi:putative acetyltransferase
MAMVDPGLWTVLWTGGHILAVAGLRSSSRFAPAPITLITMSVTVRPMRDDESRSFLEIQRAAVRGLAINDYRASVIEEWAPLPVTDAACAVFRVNQDDEIRLIAELDGELVGIGALVLAGSELRGCYVVPAAARKGVGSALVAEIERIALHHGLTHLELLSSLTAKPFYRALGYEVGELVEHVLRSGNGMAAVKMRKTFTPE